MEKLANNYFEFLLNKKRASANTISSYKRDIVNYIKYLKDNNFDGINANSTMVLNYLLDIQKAGKSPATASRALASIRSFYQYLMQNKKVTSDPTYKMHSFNSERKLPRGLSEIQINLLLDTPVCRNIKGFRDKAMLETMYATGMSVSDIINIRLTDINLKIGYINCRHEGKERVIPIYTLARDSIKDYLEKRDAIPNSDKTDFLFLNLSGEPLSRQGLWKILKTYLKKAQLPTDITPHSLRHSFALHLLENGADLKSVKDMLGHVNITSTQVYEKQLKDKMTQVYFNAHPGSKRK